MSIGQRTVHAHCGCFFVFQGGHRYLPLLSVDVHTTVLATTSRTRLTQAYVNPTRHKIEELKYIFPLYDGVSVVKFTCHVGDRVLEGVVKERDLAKREYEEAKSQGHTVGLLAQSPEVGDVFSTSLGNVGPNDKVQVVIEYIGELKHDMEVDGVRFTIPTFIAPRYGYGNVGSASGNPFTHSFVQQGISFTIDAEVPEGAAITAIRSPSHPIAVSIGKTSSATEGTALSLGRASATLSLGSVELDKDIIVQIVSTNSGDPAAVVEKHPTLATQALMVTLVPKFTLPAEKPEIAFLCDRSGSMAGSSERRVKAALRIFLKSLPVGVLFNIVSFGSTFDFLWPKSKPYTQESLDQATYHIEAFSANYGGTEIYAPVEATFKNRYKDMNLEVFLLTDGEISDQSRLFKLVADEVKDSKGAVRVFTLGVGQGASSSLIEGVARAGNGFAQTVGSNENMDNKVVRMLKGALFPHITDYSLEIKYNKGDMSDVDEEFELIDKISDALVIKEKEPIDRASNLSGYSAASDKPTQKSPVKKTISLFQPDLKEDLAPHSLPETKRFDHLPLIDVPKYLQTPTEIPPLFPFNRTTAYVLLNDNNAVLESVILRGSSEHGPLELEIPVTTLENKASTIHQLAARREIKELEDGRGWLSYAKDASGKLLKDKHEGRYTQMVEREGIRLGTTFQIAGRWTSFIALQRKSKPKKPVPAPTKGLENAQGDVVIDEEVMKQMEAELHDSIFAPTPDEDSDDYEMGFAVCDDAYSAKLAPTARQNGRVSISCSDLWAHLDRSPVYRRERPHRLIADTKASRRAAPYGAYLHQGVSITGQTVEGQARAHYPMQPPRNDQMLSGTCGSLTDPLYMQYQGAQRHQQAQQYYVQQAQQQPSSLSTICGASFGQQRQHFQAQQSPPMTSATAIWDEYGGAGIEYGVAGTSPAFGGASRASVPTARSSFVSPALAAAPASASALSSASPGSQPSSDPLQTLTAAQKFTGNWSWSHSLVSLFGVGADVVSNLLLPAIVSANGGDNDIFATICAIVYLRKTLASDEPSWEMMVDKAVHWLEAQGISDVAALEKVVEPLF